MAHGTSWMDLCSFNLGRDAVGAAVSAHRLPGRALRCGCCRRGGPYAGHAAELLWCGGRNLAAEYFEGIPVARRGAT